MVEANPEVQQVTDEQRQAEADRLAVLFAPLIADRASWESEQTEEEKKVAEQFE